MGASRSFWNAAIRERGLTASTHRVIQTVAARLKDPDTIESAIQAAAKQTPDPRSAQWLSHGIAQGYSGLAIACGHLDRCFPNEGWEIVAHQYLERAVRDSEKNGIRSFGLHSGVCGLAFAASYLSQGKRYRRLLAEIEKTLIVGLPDWIAKTAGPGLSVSQFDVISGCAGVGAYLLTAQIDSPHRTSLDLILRWLVSITREVDGLPAWYTPGHLIIDKSMAARHPQGVMNCGMAHGIPGPLALMSLARLQGVRVAGLTATIRRVAKWLADQQLDDRWGISFPAAVPIEQNAFPVPLSPSRNAWCYGSPGVARALWLAGEALDDPEFCTLAVETMRAVLRRPIEERRIDGPGFCHGVAGLLQVTLRFAQDSGKQEFHDGARALTKQLLGLFEADSILGYRSIEAGGVKVDKPGLLEGATGIVLVLLSASSRVPPDWDRLFLLS